MRKINYKGLRVIIVLLILGFIGNFFSLYLHSGNYIPYNSFLLIETICLTLFFYNIFNKRSAKIALRSASILAFLYWIYNFVRYGTNDYMDNYQTFENILILLIVLYYYNEQIFKMNVQDIFSQPQFWIVTAYFIYFAGTFFLILYIPWLNSKEKEQYYVMNYVFTIIRTILLCIAMLIRPIEGKKDFRKNNFSKDLVQQ